MEFRKGFVVITSRSDLEVVGVYTYKNVELSSPDVHPSPCVGCVFRFVR